MKFECFCNFSVYKMLLGFFWAQQWLWWDFERMQWFVQLSQEKVHMCLSCKSGNCFPNAVVALPDEVWQRQHLGMRLISGKSQKLCSMYLFQRGFSLWPSFLVPFLHVLCFLFFQQHCLPVVSLLSCFSTWSWAFSLQIGDLLKHFHVCKSSNALVFPWN